MIEQNDEIVIRGDGFIERRIYVEPEPPPVYSDELSRSEQEIARRITGRFWTSGFKAGVACGILLTVFVLGIVELFR